jgi:putative acetyltransferase
LELTIAPAPFDSEDARRLIQALDAELSLLYPPEQRFGPNLKAEQLSDGRGLFLIAREGSRPVGCGAIRVVDPETAELKRMYATTDLRGRGVGRAVLEALEAAARVMGLKRLVLETGIHQHAAIALYTKAGYTQVECWGEYASSPTSVCYAKDLRDQPEEERR